MSAEEIYPLLDDSDMTETMDQHLYDKETNPNSSSDKSSKTRWITATNNEPKPRMTPRRIRYGYRTQDNDTPPQQPDEQDAGESGEAEPQPQDANEGNSNTQQQCPDEPSEDGEPTAPTREKPKISRAMATTPCRSSPTSATSPWRMSGGRIAATPLALAYLCWRTSDRRGA